MNAALNRITAPDAYTVGSTIDTSRDVDHINIDTANQAVYWQLKEYRPPLASRAADWTNEVYMPPGSRIIDRDGVTGIRVRAATPAAQIPAGQSQAVVTVEVAFV